MQTAYNLENLQVLIVEDNKYMQLLLQNILRMFRIRRVRTAGDGADGLQELKNFNPDIIICDWNMGVLDGLEFTRLVRTSVDSNNPYVPIIMLSGYTEAYRIFEARDAGMTEYLAKPVSAALLYDRICQIVERPRQFVKTKGFFGPDRRRSKPTPQTNKGRRKGDTDADGADDNATGDDEATAEAEADAAADESKDGQADNGES